MVIASDSSERANDLDYIIEVSILKIRRMQITGVREERQRLLILETLHRSIAQKLAEQEEAASEDRTSAFLSILQDAVGRLGLSRIVKFCISLPEGSGSDTLPRLKIPATRKGNRGDYFKDLVTAQDA